MSMSGGRIAFASFAQAGASDYFKKTNEKKRTIAAVNTMLLCFLCLHKEMCILYNWLGVFAVHAHKKEEGSPRLVAGSRGALFASRFSGAVV